jgi:hypothetical protein
VPVASQQQQTSELPALLGRCWYEQCSDMPLCAAAAINGQPAHTTGLGAPAAWAAAGSGHAKWLCARHPGPWSDQQPQQLTRRAAEAGAGHRTAAARCRQLGVHRAPAVWQGASQVGGVAIGSVQFLPAKAHYAWHGAVMLDPSCADTIAVAAAQMAVC